MDMKEKLVELLRGAVHINSENVEKWILGGKQGEIPNIFNTQADHLIDHGVTVQEWISVKDMLPEKQGFYRVFHKNSKAICDRFYYKDCPDLFVNVKDDPVTHWKPMEQPPKGE